MRPSELIRRVLRYSIAAVAVLYIYWTEARIHNLQAITDLIYDTSTCIHLGDARETVRHRLIELGYSLNNDHIEADSVSPNLLLGGWTFRVFYVRIEYNSAGKVERDFLVSGIGAL